MKTLKLVICTLILICPLLSTAQGWERTYDGGLNELINAADRTLDGGIVMAGIQIDNANNMDYPFLYKTDAEGNLLWEFYDSLHAASFVNTQDVISTQDGNYLMGIIYGNNPPNNDYVLQKIDPNGNILWANNLSSYEVEYITDIQETADSSFILLGAFDNNMAGGTNISVLKLDANGDLLWEQTFTSNNFPIFPGQIMETQNGDAVVCAYQGFATAQDGRVIRLDAQGNTVWDNVFDYDDNDFMVAVTELSDSSLMVAGLSSTDFSLTNPLLVKLNKDGNEIWAETYTDHPVQNITGIVAAQDGGFAITGHGLNPSPNGTDIFLIKTNPNGNIDWLNYYGRSRDDFSADILLADDNGYYLIGDTEKPDNSEDAYLIKTDSLGVSISNQLNGIVFHDLNFSCTIDAQEAGLSQWLIEANKDDIQYLTLSDTAGNYSMTLDTGSYAIQIYPVSPYWELCDSTFSITFSNQNELISENIAAQAIVDCPLMDISIGTSFLRRCFENTYSVLYCNYGTVTAEDAETTIVLDPDMIFQDASIPVANQVGDTLIFELGDVPIGACGSFSFDVVLGDSMTCDSIELGATHCVIAAITPDTICLQDENWSGASMEVDAVCQGDSIVFIITNVGSASSQPGLQYLVIEDDVILREETYQLNPDESEFIAVETTGGTFRLEVEQEPNHPGTSMPSTAVEGCGPDGQSFSLGFINIYDQDDGNSFVDIDCRENIGSYDPNDKTGYPLGYGAENFIDRGQELEYLIRFQNTGTDTAFTVVVLDTISDKLDITSVRPGAASHPYTFELLNNGVLSFTFNDILLPDSSVNEPALNGFVKFKIHQQPNLDLGTSIQNSAAIYFDFNAPIITNETIHTIGEDYVITAIIDPPGFEQATIKVFPNPFQEEAFFEIEKEVITEGRFFLYDARGRLVKTFEFDQNNFVLHKGVLTSGLYFFRIENGRRLIASGKLIKG